MLKYIVTKEGGLDVTKKFIAAVIVISIILGLGITQLLTKLGYDPVYRSESMQTVTEQRATIGQLNDSICSLSRQLENSIDRSEYLISGLSKSVELAGQSDSIIGSLRTAMAESGTSIGIVVERQQRINRLAKQLIQDHEELKSRLRILAEDNEGIKSPD